MYWKVIFSPHPQRHVVDQFKNGVEVVDKAKNTGDAYQTNERKEKAAKKYDREHFIEIDGQKLVKDQRYRVTFLLDGINSSGEMTPSDFLRMHSLEKEQGRIEKLKFKKNVKRIS